MKNIGSKLFLAGLVLALFSLPSNTYADEGAACESKACGVFDAALDAEERDDRWAEEQEAAVRRALEVLDGVRSASVHCKTTLCHYRFVIDAERFEAGSQDFDAALTDFVDFNQDMMTGRPLGNGDVAVDAYFSREGFLLPGGAPK